MAQAAALHELTGPMTLVVAQPAQPVRARLGEQLLRVVFERCALSAVYCPWR